MRMAGLTVAAGLTGSTALAGDSALIAFAVPAAAVLLLLVWVLASNDRTRRLTRLIRALRGADRGNR